MLYYSELFEKNVSILNFMILNIDLALSRYCLWSWDYLAHALHYAIVFFEKKLLLLACLAVVKYAAFIWILAFQWLMQDDGYKYLQDFRRPFSSFKSNEEWTHIALTFFCMKWLIVDRLTRVRLMTLWNVWG